MTLEAEPLYTEVNSFSKIFQGIEVTEPVGQGSTRAPRVPSSVLGVILLTLQHVITDTPDLVCSVMRNSLFWLLFNI